MEKGNLKVSELRIGNYIKLMLNDEDFAVIEVTLNDLEAIDNKKGIFEPIVLTEEWLVRFGFEGSEIFKNSYILNSVEIYIQDGLYWYDFGNDRVEIKYVHSLQNLVHALTNEELTIKENGK